MYLILSVGRGRMIFARTQQYSWLDLTYFFPVILILLMVT